MILIIGSNGQLGREMQRALSLRGQAFAACDYPDIDIAKVDSLDKWLKDVRPSAVVNCAAYTNVNKAESEYDNAYTINALGPKNIAALCADKGIEMVHISTDYVFNGMPIMVNGVPRPYVETDACGPVTAYGKTKLAGEEFVQAGCEKYYILRTAWLYGDGNNFVRTMLKLAETNSEVRVVNDQFGSPTSTVDLANAVCALLGTGEYRLYHATCEGQCSWYDFAKKIFELKQTGTRVVPINSEEFVSPAKRPAWSVLENENLKRLNKNVFRPWEDAIAEYLGK